MNKEEPELPFERCIHCNAILSWPGIALPRMERLVFDSIYNAMVPVPTSKHLARTLGTSYQNVRAMISRINKKLQPKNLRIVAYPLRIIKITEISHALGTQVPDR